MSYKSKYPITVFGVECHTNEDVQRATREWRDRPDRDRAPLRFTITTVEVVEVDPMWLDEDGRLKWGYSPTEVGGETPIEEEYRKAPAEYLEKARRIAGSVFKTLSYKTTVKPKGQR